MQGKKIRAKPFPYAVSTAGDCMIERWLNNYLAQHKSINIPGLGT
jgi:hypothetical protein